MIPRRLDTVNVEVDAMASRALVPTELFQLREILGRRDPELFRLIDDTSGTQLDEHQRARIRRAVVDELCDLPSGDGRRALELQELLTHLGEADVS